MHLWFTIGRLDANIEQSRFCFRYTAGAKLAQETVGLPPLLEFPNFYRAYRSNRLFALFRNRVVNPSRPDRLEYLEALDLSENANPIEVLSVNGGERVTDPYEVFPKLVKDRDGRFKCRFFLRGWRYLSKRSRDRILSLKGDEGLQVAIELNHSVTGLALQLQTQDYCLIGWAPRFLVDDIAKAISEGDNDHEASVVKINQMPPASDQRILIELRGKWENHEPMASNEFTPISGAV